MERKGVPSTLNMTYGEITEKGGSTQLRFQIKNCN